MISIPTMRSLAFLVLTSIPFALTFCPPPGPILSPPKITTSSFSISDSTFESQAWLNNTSLSIKASIGSTEILQHAHAAPGYHESSYPLHETQLRIASITKLFTLLAVKLAKDRIGWEDPIGKYVPELSGNPAYDEVTISALAGHTSGLGRFGYVGDLALIPGFQPAQFGIPAVNNTLPGCDPFPGGRICTRQELLDMYNNDAYEPHSPNSGPLYSNIAYILLGLALETTYSKSYEEVVQDLILTPLNLNHTSFEIPTDAATAILPQPGDTWFVADFGNYNPTGGIWSTPDNMLTFLQSLLKHSLLTPAETRKWLQPRSLLPSLQQLVGAPWEILRPNDLDVSFPRPIDMYTKSGGVRGYAGFAILVPEYDLAVTINAAGNQSSLAVQDLLPLIMEPLITYADATAREQAKSKYAGTYTSTSNPNNTLTLSLDSGPGLSITAFTINGVPVLRSLAALQDVPLENFSAGLYPTDPDSLGTGKEYWRILLDTKESAKTFAELNCDSWNLGDPYRYVREPLDTVVFDIIEDSAVSLELLGWRTTLEKGYGGFH